MTIRFPDESHEYRLARDALINAEMQMDRQPNRAK